MFVAEVAHSCGCARVNPTLRLLPHLIGGGSVPGMGQSTCRYLQPLRGMTREDAVPSVIVVAREGGFPQHSRAAYTVRIDDTKVGRLKAGEVASYPVARGRHRVRMTIDWASSPTREPELVGGEVFRFVCRPSGRGGEGLMGLLLSAVHPSQYLELVAAP